MATDSREHALGRRIVIWGATGAGKTTLAGNLSRALGLHQVELDAIKHAQGWDSTPREVFRELLTKRLDSHPVAWVTAGGYSEVSDIYLSRADTVVWLHLPWRVSFWRLFKRTIRRAWDGSELYEGSPARESWRLSFFSSKSILRWSITQHRNTTRKFQQRIKGLPPHIRVLELTSARDVEALVRQAQSSSSVDSSMH